MAGILSKIAGGINTAANELMTPTSGIGKLGMYLNMASGNALGGAQGMAAKDARQQQQDAWAAQDRSIAAEDRVLDREYRQAQIQKMLQPPKPGNTYEQIVARLGQDQGDSYLRLLAEGPPIAMDVQAADGSVTRQYMPRSQFTGGQQESVPGGPPSPPDGNFLTFDQFRSMQQGMGGNGFAQWQNKFGTPVEVGSKTQMDALPSGTMFRAPDGSIRTKR